MISAHKRRCRKLMPDEDAEAFLANPFRERDLALPLETFGSPEQVFRFRRTKMVSRVNEGESCKESAARSQSAITGYCGVCAKNFQYSGRKGQDAGAINHRESQGQGSSTLRAIAAELNAREIDAPRGRLGSALQVQRVLAQVHSL